MLKRFLSLSLLLCLLSNMLYSEEIAPPLSGETKSRSLIPHAHTVEHPDFLIETITAEEIRKSGIKDIPQLIYYLSNFMNISFSTRSMTPFYFLGSKKVMSRVGIYLNGVAFMDIFTDLPLINVLPITVDEIKKIIETQVPGAFAKKAAKKKAAPKKKAATKTARKKS